MRHSWLTSCDGWAGSRRSTVVLCLAQAGQGPAPFARWPNQIDGVELCALRFPGDREPAWWAQHATIAAQAADLAAELADPPAAQFALFGQGSSALIVYEAAGHLTRAAGPAPCRLFVSGCPAPNRARRRGPQPDTSQLEERALTTCLEYGGNPLPSLLWATVRAMTAEATAMLVYEPPAASWPTVPIDAVSWSRDPAADLPAMADWETYGPTELMTLEGSEHSYMHASNELLKLFTRA